MAFGAHSSLGQLTRDEERPLALRSRAGLNPPRRGKHDWGNESLYDPWFAWWGASEYKWDARLCTRV